MSRRELVVTGAVHAALIVATWLAATMIYAVVVVGAPQPAWLAIDLALIAGAAVFVHHHRARLGFRALGDRRGAKLLAILALGLVCALVVQLVVHDDNGIWDDESNYLRTVRTGEIVRDGLMPFNLRWLIPFFAGRWNVLALDDADALKALNFGAFALTAGLLILLLVRLRVPLRLALTAPIFLLCSTLGTYGAHNRLVLDATNYAMFVVLFHLVIRRAHAAWFGVALLVTAFNAEKAIYWLPVFGLVRLFELPRPWRLRDVVEPAWLTARVCGATVLYLIALRLYVHGSHTEWNLCFENLDVMAFSDLHVEIANPNVVGNTFQALWFPFGAFTVYALLGFAIAPRWMKPVLLLLIPILIQNVIACDASRMVAYTFIVFLPFGYLYLTRALADLPRAIARPLWIALIVLVILGSYDRPLLGFFRRHGFPALAFVFHDAVAWKTILSGLEIALVGALIFLHLGLFRGPSAGRTDRD